MTPPPLTPQQAEEHAKKAVGAYLTACNLQNRDQIGDVLMKLVSVAGVMMANAEGSEMAFDRLLGTAQFVLQRMPKKPAHIGAIQ